MPSLTLLFALSLVAPPAELVDCPYAADFARALPAGLAAYDNWGKPDFGWVATSPLGGPAARIAFDDTSTVGHFDKGFVLRLPEPVPWTQVDRITARYHVDRPVANVRIIVHDDGGGWYDYTDSKPVIGAAGTVTARRDDLRLAWTDDPKQPAPTKTGKLRDVFVSVHNVKPPNSGEKFVLHLDTLRLEAVLLGGTQLEADGARLGVWPIARRGAGEPWRGAVALPFGTSVVWALADGDNVRLIGLTNRQVAVALAGRSLEPTWTRQGAANRFEVTIPRADGFAADTGTLALAVGEGNWTGRYAIVPPLRPVDALALSVRSGALRWEPEANLVPGDPVAMRVIVPAAWADVTASAALTAAEADPVPLADHGQTVAATGRRLLLQSAQAPAPGAWRAELTLKLGPDTLAVTRALDVPEVDRQTLAPAAVADQQARAVAGRRAPWWAREPLATTPRVPDRERVDPVAWTRVKDPVTWQDLGGSFTGGAQCGVSENDLKLFFGHYDFGTVIKPHLGYFINPGWEANVKRLADSRLLVTSLWGYVPYEPWNGGFGAAVVPKAADEALRGQLGRRFLGYEMGEQDGRYIGAYAPRHRPRTRVEAERLSDAWHQEIMDALHGRLVALGSLTFEHQYARLGHRMIGIESSQGLPSDIMQWAFLRGASKQYGVLPWNCISIFNRWGYKSYGEAVGDHGPDKGPTVSLLHRLWYTSLLAGSAINMFESAYTLPEKDAAGFPKLSPVGREHIDGMNWARQHADRGVQYAPVALMLDQHSGWAPPRHLYTADRYKVWGNLPYARGDHATDAFFRWVWPHYEDCSYYEDERGFLTATPHGDLFDVIQSDAPAECLRRYQTVVLLGARVDAATAKRLADFVRAGGELIGDLQRLPADLTGVDTTARRAVGQRSILAASGKILVEEPYSYLVGKSRGAEALALSESGDGILWQRRLGQGRVIASGVPDYVAAATEDPQPGVDVPLRHKLLAAFTEVVGGYLDSLALVHVSGGPVQVVTNVGADKRRLVVTVVNNETKPTQVTLTPATGQLESAETWLGPAKTEGGQVTVDLPAGELAVVALRLRP